MIQRESVETWGGACIPVGGQEGEVMGLHCWLLENVDVGDSVVRGEDDGCGDITIFMMRNRPLTNNIY